MKRMFIKIVSLVLTLLLVLTAFSACNSKPAEPSTDEIVNAAVQAALDAVATTASVTIDADGKQVTLEDASGKTVGQLLEQAGIDLNEGDLLTISPDQVFASDMTFLVLRFCTVTIIVEETGSDYTATILGGTVADALADANITLEEYHTVNYELDQLLQNGMEIIISGEEPPEETEATEATEPEKSYSGGSSGGGSSGGSSSSSSSGGSSSSSGSSGNSGNSGSSGNSGNSGSGGNSGGSGSEDSKPEVETKPQKTVVSVQYYDDCDGSGHGVKVITYSDGTQEEVPY